MIDYKEILKDKEVLEIYKEIDKTNPHPFNHGLQHVENVIEIMKRVTKILDIDDKTRDKLLIVTALHDVGRLREYKNHAYGSMTFSKEYLKDKIYGEDLEEILTAIEHHSDKELENLSLFSSIICFCDKMDFSIKRLEPHYIGKDKIYEKIKDIYLDYKDEILYVKIITKNNNNIENDLRENNFFNKALKVLKGFALKINSNYEIYIDDKIFDI